MRMNRHDIIAFAFSLPHSFLPDESDEPVPKVIYCRPPLAGSDIAVIELEGDYDSLDHAVNQRLQGLLARHLTENESPCIVMDLARTEVIGARFVGLVLAATQSAAARSPRLAFCGANTFCREVLLAARADALCGIYSTRQEALDALSAA